MRVIVGLLQRGDTCLIAQRLKADCYAGYWEFPGGKIEEGEDSASALQRELFEELGIQVISSKWFSCHTHYYPDKTIYLEAWLVHEYKGEPFGKEGQEIKWVSLTERFFLPLLQASLPVFEKLKKHFSTRTTLCL